MQRNGAMNRVAQVSQLEVAASDHHHPHRVAR